MNEYTYQNHTITTTNFLGHVTTTKLLGYTGKPKPTWPPADPLQNYLAAHIGNTESIIHLLFTTNETTNYFNVTNKTLTA